MRVSGIRHGFTLLESAMVLAIIALAVGAIVIGTHMYQQAGLLKIITEHDVFASGVQNFQTRFDALPGDMANATDYWGTDPECPNGGGMLSGSTNIQEETCNGDGNKIIEGDWNATDPYQETLRFWQHLANAGLIPGKYAGGSAGIYNGGCGVLGISIPATQADQARGSGWELVPVYTSVTPGIYGGGFFPGMDPLGYTQEKYYGLLARLATCHRSPGDAQTGPSLSPADARYIDMKVDDGKPWGGRMTSITAIDAAVTTCVTSAAPEFSRYRTSTSKGCIIFFEMEK